MLALEDLTHAFRGDPGGRELAVLCGISLQCQRGEICVVVGPSGCGKTTLLNLIAGLFPPTGGRIRRPAGSDGRPPRVGYVFQTPSLIPWRTIRENALFGTEIGGRVGGDVQRRCGALLESCGLLGFQGAYPSRLSGGMQQRVSIVRAVLSGAEVMLLDEPFSNTDYLMRRCLQGEVARLVEVEKLIAILVTHDIEEAVRMADKVVVLSERPAQVKAEIRIPVSRAARIGGGSLVMKEMAPFVERVEEVFGRGAKMPQEGQSNPGGA